MAEGITPGEYRYYRNERVALDSIAVGARYVLFACMSGDVLAVAMEHNVEESDTSLSRPTAYVRVGCTITSKMLPKPEFEDMLQGYIDSTLHVNLDSMSLSFTTEPNNTIMTRQGCESAKLLQVFLDVHLGNGISTKRGLYRDDCVNVWMPEGFFVDAENAAGVNGASLKAAHGGNDDDASGVREPQSPRSPTPAIAVER